MCYVVRKAVLKLGDSAQNTSVLADAASSQLNLSLMISYVSGFVSLAWVTHRNDIDE